MKPRRDHSNSKRKTEIIFSPGGLLLDSGTYNVATGDAADWNQQTFATDSESQPAATEHTQPAHHAIPSFDSQLASTVESGEPVSSTVSVILTSFASSLAPTTVTPPIGFSHRSSSLLTEHSRFSSSRPSGSSTSAALAVASNMDESSSSALSVPTAPAAGYSAEFYGGIAFISVASLVCVVAIVTYLLRSRRKSSMCCGSSKKDDDVESQDFGRGLGLYVDKSASETALAGIPSLQASHCAAEPPIGSPATPMRPVAPHLPTCDSILVPKRLLGPLRVRNYVSGDFPSSSDEAVPSPPNYELGSPREQQPGGTPRYLGLQGPDVLWTPWNFRLSREPNQVNIAHSATKKSGVAQASDEEQNYTLPTPPFGRTQSRNDCEKGSPYACRDTFSSGVHRSVSGINGNTSRRGENDSPALPGNYPRSDRWRTVLSSQKAPISDMVTSQSAGGIPVNPEGGETFEHPPAKLGQDSISFDTIGLRLRMGEQGVSGAIPLMASTAPLVVSKKLGTRKQSKRRPGSVKPKAISRTSSMYSPLFDVSRQSSRRPTGFAKRGSAASQSSVTTEKRPEFLRQATRESVTSFTSEASERSRVLTAEELRAKRTLMLRARRKRGMGTVNGTRTESLTRGLTHTGQSPDSNPPGARGDLKR